MHKRRIRGPNQLTTPALKLRLLRLRSIHPSPKSTKHVTLNYFYKILSYLLLLLTWYSTMGNSDRAKFVVYVEFGFLGLGTMVAGILILFPTFFLAVFLEETPPELVEIEEFKTCYFEFLCKNREQLKEGLGTLKILGSAVIAIALLAWLIVVLTLCQGVRGISPPRLLIWLVINSIPTLAGIGVVTYAVTLNPDNVWIHVPGITFLLYKLWSLWVVRGLRKDILSAGPPDNFHALHHRQSRSYSTHSTPHPFCPS